MHVSNYYYHSISKDNIETIYSDFEKILSEGMLKSQKLLNKDSLKFNGTDYISLASYVKPSIYKTLLIDENSFEYSKISNLFSSYSDYLEYMKQNEWLETPLTRNVYFEKYNVTEKREYYNYLDSIARTYPVDIKYLYNKTNDVVYKYILDMIHDDILYCNKSEYCFDEYIKKSNGITFVFPKTVEFLNVHIIPNLPFNIESKLVNVINNLSNRYSNQIGEVQVKDYLDIKNSIGIIINDMVDINIVLELLKKYNINIKLLKLCDEEIIEV